VEDDVREMEERKRPMGTVLLCGLGRLGIRVFVRLLDTHRGGPRTIVCYDGQRVDGNDTVHMSLGARIGENKARFAARLGARRTDRRVVGVPEYVGEGDAEGVVRRWRPDVVVSMIAGGRTTPVTAALARAASRVGAVSISTGGVFGFGDEDVSVVRLEEAEGPPAEELRRFGAPGDHLVVTTGRFIRDPEPLSPVVLERVADAITVEVLRALHLRRR